MIRKNNEMIHEIRENMRGGAGTVKITNYVGKDEMHGKARLFAEILLEPGCGELLTNTRFFLASLNRYPFRLPFAGFGTPSTIARYRLSNSRSLIF